MTPKDKSNPIEKTKEEILEELKNLGEAAPSRESFDEDKDYAEAWIKHYGSKMDRTQEQWKRLIRRYGIKQVCKMEDMTQAEVREEAGLTTFKDKIAKLKRRK